MNAMKRVSVVVVLLALFGCGKGPGTRPQQDPGPPPSQESPLAPLAGAYRVVDVDGEPADSGELVVVDKGVEIGLSYSAVISGVAYARLLRTPASGTELSLVQGHVHTKYESGGYKLSIDYDRRDRDLLLEITECKPGVCLVTLLTARLPE